MQYILRISLFLLALLTLPLGNIAWCKEAKEPKVQKPNIVVIYMDDLGFGDMGSYGSIGLKTPNMDALAQGGLRFTNGYASSATCTPSRYAILTGSYPWRNKDAHILPGTAPLLIDTDQMTVPKMLKKAGYQTGAVGKWHLGLGNGKTDWNKPISPGPNETGFDYSFIMAATQDRVPTVYIENGTVVGLDPDDPIEVSYKHNFDGEPTALDHPEMVKMKWSHGHNNSIVNGIPRIGFMKGGETAKWQDTLMADTYLRKAKEFVKKHKESPFFLYYALNEPHVPRTPNPRFVGKSGMGPRGDAILEADWCIGQFMDLLKRQGLLENTLVIFSSDNGPVLDDGYQDRAVELNGDHKPSGPFRGGKYSLYEGGTHVPFVTFWKGKIKSGVSDALVCQMDLLASLADLVGVHVDTADSKNLMDVFLGKSDRGRQSLVLEASGRTALRAGNWIMIPPHKGPRKDTQVNIELGNSPEYQLFDLSRDIGEQENLATKKPKKLKKMKQKFQKLTSQD